VKGVSKNFRAASGKQAHVQQLLQTPHLCVGGPNRLGTLLPPAFKSQNSRRTGFVVAPLAFLNGTCCCTLPRSPRERNACNHQRDSRQAVSPFEWLGSTSNSTGLGGEVFGIRRNARPRTRIAQPYGANSEHTCFSCRGGFQLLSMGSNLASPPPGYYTSSLSTDRGFEQPTMRTCSGQQSMFPTSRSCTFYYLWPILIGYIRSNRQLGLRGFDDRNGDRGHFATSAGEIIRKRNP